MSSVKFYVSCIKFRAAMGVGLGAGVAVISGWLRLVGTAVVRKFGACSDRVSVMVAVGESVSVAVIASAVGVGFCHKPRCSDR